MIGNVWARLGRRRPVTPKTVLLHAGAGKTGTSAIQTWLARNHRRLEAHGVYYPRPPEGFDLAVEGKITTGNATRLVEYAVRRRRPASFKEAAFFAWLDEVLRHPSETVLFSGETLPGGDREHFKVLRDYFEQRNCRVRVIYAVRNAADHAFSKWGQLIKRHGSYLTWDQYCRRSSIPFLKVLDGFSAVFGRDAIQVINYERDKHDIVRRLLSLVTPATFEDTKVGIVNRSLSEEEVEMMRVFNAAVFRRTKNTVLRDRLATDLSDYLIYTADLPPLKLTLTEDQFAWLQRTLGDTVEALNRAYLPHEPIAVADPKVVTDKVPSARLGGAERLLMNQLAACTVAGTVDLRKLEGDNDRLHALSRAVRGAAARGTAA